MLSIMEDINNMIRCVSSQLRGCLSYKYNKEDNTEYVSGDDMDNIIKKYMTDNNLTSEERKVVLYIFYMSNLTHFIRNVD